MRILKLNQEIKLSYEKDANVPQLILKKDVEYVLPDIIPITLLNQGFKSSIVYDNNFYEDERIKKKIYNGENLFGKKLITFRNGGVGDLIFQLPSLKDIKDTYNENVKLSVCCNEQYLSIFNDLPYLDNVISLPLELDVLLQNDYFVNFEGLIESSERAEFINAYDLHAEKFFVKPKNMNPILVSNEKNDSIVLNEINRDKINIVIAFQASAPIRSVHPDIYANLIAEVGLKHPNVKFYICGTKNQCERIDIMVDAIKKQANVYNCINWSKKHSDLGLTISLIKYSDCVISPDSGLLHIAGGFNIPCIGLYGAFPSKLRIGYYINAIGLDANSNCIFAERNKFKSCFQHGVGSCKSAIKNAEVYSPCMNIFKPNDIYQTLNELKILNKKNEEEKG